MSNYGCILFNFFLHFLKKNYGEVLQPFYWMPIVLDTINFKAHLKHFRFLLRLNIKLCVKLLLTPRLLNIL